MDIDMSNQRVLIFVPKHNSHGKRDVTGAFLPEAKRLLAVSDLGSVLEMIDNKQPMAKRRKSVLRRILELSEAGCVFDSVAVFCHGWQDGIQIGFSRKSVMQFAEAISLATKGNQKVTVPLFCCSTGEDPEDESLTAAGTGDDSFADKLRDALCEIGLVHCRVMAHTTVAHTTSNPMVLFMDGMGSYSGGAGGYAPVSPKSRLWGPWKRALRDRRNNTLRLRFSWMTVEEIHEELNVSRRPR